jgi:hypothetical protein
LLIPGVSSSFGILYQSIDNTANHISELFFRDFSRIEIFFQREGKLCDVIPFRCCAITGTEE